MKNRNLKARVLGKGPHVRPPLLCLLGVIPLAVLAVALESLLLGHTLGDGDPADELVASQRFLDRPPDFRDALDLAWRRALAGSAELEGNATQLLAPTLPPPLCPAASGLLAETGPLAGELDGGVRGLAAALRQKDRTAIIRALDRLDQVDESALGEGGQFLLRYNKALGNAARDEHDQALRLLRPVIADFASEERVPTASLEMAELLRSWVGTERPAAAFHARMLAGLAAYHDRGSPELAISHFRVAINTAYYFVPVGRGVEVGHYKRVEVPNAAWACSGQGGSPPLTSLDGYTGLVAAYLVAPDFREPSRLATEVARADGEIDASDPLLPVLLYAQATAGRSRPVIPEHYLWAASNLQRVSYHNRRSDPRLEAVRAFILLKIAGEDAWQKAVSRVRRFEPCPTARRVARDLALEEELHAGRQSDPLRADTLRAALAIRAHALGQGCEEGGPASVVVDDTTRSRWIRTAGRRVAGGVAGHAETLRLRLLSGIREESPGEVEGVIDEIDPMLWQLWKGKVPAEFPATLDTDVAYDFMDAWRNALFAETARNLVRRAGGDPDAPPLSAAEVPDYLAAVWHTAAQAGLRPVDIPGATALLPLMRSQGLLREMTYRVGQEARNVPWLACLLYAVVVVLTLWLAVRAYWMVWSYHVLVRARFYAREASARRGGGRDDDGGDA